MGATFTPTHMVPSGGMRAWPKPDGTGPEAFRFDGGSEVAVLEEKSDWARVVDDEGREGWVDARRLSDLAAAPTLVEPAPVEPVPEDAAAAEPAVAEPAVAEPAVASAAGGIEVRGTSIVTLVGGVAIALGTFLDWWSIGGLGVSAWDIPIKFLLTGKGTGGLDTGPIVVVLAAVLAVGLVLGRRLPPVVVLGVSGIVLGLAGAATVRGMTNDPSLYPQVGLLVTIGGGVLVATDGLGVWNGRSR